MELSGRNDEGVREPKGLLVLGGYNMDYVTEVPHLLISVNCELIKLGKGAEKNP